MDGGVHCIIKGRDVEELDGNIVKLFGENIDVGTNEEGNDVGIDDMEIDEANNGNDIGIREWLCDSISEGIMNGNNNLKGDG